MTWRILQFVAKLSLRQAGRRARRSVAAFLGVIGGLVLAFSQLGIQEALYESSVRLHRVLNGEVVVVPREFDMMLNPVWFDRNALSSAAAQPFVADITYLSTISPMVRGLNNNRAQPVLILGVDPLAPAIDVESIGADLTAISIPGNALWDRRSQHHWGDIAGRLSQEGHVELTTAIASLALQFPVTVVGTFALGGSIVSLGTMIVSNETFVEIGGQDEERPNLAVIRLAPGTDPEQAAAALNELLPGYVQAISLGRLIASEKLFWSSETPIGFFMNLSAAIGVVVCAIFVGQALVQTIDENLSEYAVLKTLDVPDWAFVTAIVLTGVLIVVSALPFSAIMSLVIYRGAMLATDLPFELTVNRIVLVAVAAGASAILAGLVTGRRILHADPARLL